MKNIRRGLYNISFVKFNLDNPISVVKNFSAALRNSSIKIHSSPFKIVSISFNTIQLSPFSLQNSLKNKKKKKSFVWFRSKNTFLLAPFRHAILRLTSVITYERRSHRRGYISLTVLTFTLKTSSKHHHPSSYSVYRFATLYANPSPSKRILTLFLPPNRETRDFYFISFSYYRATQFGLPGTQLRIHLLLRSKKLREFRFTCSLSNDSIERPLLSTSTPVPATRCLSPLLGSPARIIIIIIISRGGRTRMDNSTKGDVISDN